MITDDHKDKEKIDSAPPTPPDAVPDAQAPGLFTFQSMPAAPHYSAGLQMSYSTPNLSSLGCVPPQSFAMPQHYVPAHAPQLSNVSASHFTGGTSTPYNRSRQASPTGLSERQQKKRKASGSGRIYDELRMTPMHSPQNQNGQFSHFNFGNAPTVNAANGNAANGMLPNRQSLNGNVPNRAAIAARRPAHLPSTYTHRVSNSYHAVGFRTNPPSPHHGDFSAFSSANRSQSMENFSTSMFSANTSTHQSRAHSPTYEAGNFMNYRPELAQALDQGLLDAQATNGNMQIRPTSQPRPQLDTPSHQILNPQAPQPSVVSQTLSQPPAIKAVDPAQGPVEGRNQCIVAGTDFHSDLLVFFGNRVATEVRCLAGSTLVIQVPAGERPGPVPISLISRNPQQSPSASPESTHEYHYIDESLGSSLPGMVKNEYQQSSENLFGLNQASQQYPNVNVNNMAHWVQVSRFPSPESVTVRFRALLTLDAGT